MKSPLTPIVIFFVIVNAITVVFGQRLRDKGFDTNVVLIGNLILAFTSAVSVYIYSKSKKSTKGHAVVRNVYGGFMLKFFVLIVAAMVYFFFAEEINKNAIFACLGLYLIYNVIGTRQAIKKTPAVSNDHTHSHSSQHKHHSQHHHHSHKKK